jgi:hypothetical protein
VDGLFVANQLVDLCFLLDVIRHFRTAYFDKHTLHANRHAIRNQYLRTYFLVDVASIIPFDAIEAVAHNTAGQMSSLRILRLLRLGKLLKLARLLRGEAPAKLLLLDGLANNLKLKKQEIAALFSVLLCVLVIYWSGCCVAILPHMQGKTQLGAETWADRYLPVGSTETDEFVAAIYFAASTTLTVGE